MADGCNEVDDDCDGAVDEDCSACLHVAPTGDDAVAIASGGLGVFATIQTAIDFADAHREGQTRVCVAAGATCGESASYFGPADSDLTMRDGIDVLGGYESTSWKRCTDAATTTRTVIRPRTARGVYFPASIGSPTVLDGFIIEGPELTGTVNVSGVTVEGGKDVLLSNVRVKYGVKLSDAQARIFRSRIEGHVFHLYAGWEGATLRANNSRVLVDDSCTSPPDPVTGRCVTDCSLEGPRLQLGQYGDGIVLENSPGSRILRSSVCGTNQSRYTESAAVRIAGSSTGTSIVASDFRADSWSNSSTPAPLLRLQECGGAAPWIVNNVMTRGQIGGTLIAVSGNCHPVIESNPRLLAKVYDSYVYAISCDRGSRCVITANSEVGIAEPTRSFSSAGIDIYGWGVRCSDASCARIDRNHIGGLPVGPHIRGFRASCGVALSGGFVLIDSNFIDGGNPYNSNLGTTTTQTIGVNAGVSSARIENNEILGGSGNSYAVAVASSGQNDLHSNYLYSWLGPALATSTGDSIRNNIIRSSVTAVTGSQPAACQHNVFTIPTNERLFSASTGGATAEARTMTELEALFGSSTFGNLVTTCLRATSSSQPPQAAGHLLPGSACIDAGTSASAPWFDADGEPRDASPDIGPDEYVP
jgi:hypothetical protein